MEQKLSAYTSAIGNGTRTQQTWDWTSDLSSGNCFSRRLSPLKKGFLSPDSNRVRVSRSFFFSSVN
jgi:hypothetical protein